LEFHMKHGCAVCKQFMPPKYFTYCAEVHVIVTSTTSKVKKKKL